MKWFFFLLFLTGTLLLPLSAQARSMAWMLIAATALVLFGLAQAPELWLGPGGR